MTKEDALRMLDDYASEIQSLETSDSELSEAMGMTHRFPVIGSECKAMRWLGYMQGILVGKGVYTLDEVKNHSKNRRVTTPTIWARKRRQYSEPPVSQ